MNFPGVNSYFPHYQELYKSSKILLFVIGKRISENDTSNTQEFREFDKKLISPFILTMYSFLECFLSELEDKIDESDLELPYSRNKRPNITERPFILYNLITGKNFDKGTPIFSDYKYAIKIRNLITHGSGEWIKWTNRDVCPIGVNFSMNNYTYEKKIFKKYNLEEQIHRNKEADKIIKYLATKKLVPPYHQGRHTGWLHYISFPSVAKWTFDSYLDVLSVILIDIKKSDNGYFKQFASQAQLTLFDREMERDDYHTMVHEELKKVKNKKYWSKIKDWLRI